MINQQALIIGASSDIAKAIACQLMDDQLMVVSQSVAMQMVSALTDTKIV